MTFFVSLSVCFTVVGLWLGTFLFMSCVDADLAMRFQGLFAASGTLFSALALAGVILTMVFQSKEQKRSSLENSFFHLLGLHSQLIASLDIIESGTRRDDESRSVRLVGRDTFQEYRKQLAAAIRERCPVESEVVLSEFRSAYDRWWGLSGQFELSHYFESLRAILMLLDQNRVADHDVLAVSLSAHVSRVERTALFYHVLAVERGGTLEGLVQKYSLLPRDMKGFPLISPKHATWRDAIDASAA